MIALDTLVAAVRAAQKRREEFIGLDALKELERGRPSALDGMTALRPPEATVSVIAEVKRTTSSFADLTGMGDPAITARFFEAGGACSVSVVTESTHLQGSLADLDAVRSAVDIPVMANDLIVTTYQLHEARAHGADLIKLTVAALPQIALESLIERTHSLGMTAVVVVYSRREALIALDAGARVIAVDARHHDTLALDRTLFDQVANVLPDTVIRIAEGGVRGPHDVMDYARSGAHAVIVGEAILRSADPQQFVAELVAAGSHPALRQSSRHREAL